jgi:uncharacterized SAM-binding protein YcdF (DUF218 family)
MQKVYLTRVLRGFAHGVLVSVLSVVALVALICALIVVQGRDDDRRRFGAGQVGAAIVIGPDWNGESAAALERARLDHAVDLFRQGLVSRIIVTGARGPGAVNSAAASGKQYLVEHGMPAEALLVEDQGTTPWESLRNVAPLARTNGIGSVLIVSEPMHMLRALKMARDLDLAAYGSPTRTSLLAGDTAQETRYVLREAWAYLVYLFARQ